jgi:PKD repeat protein
MGAMPAFPLSRGAAALTETLLNGSAAEVRSGGTLPVGSSLKLEALGGLQPQYATYRFNLGGKQPDSVRVDCSCPGGSHLFMGLANQTMQRWEMRGPFTEPQSILLDQGDYVAANGDLWLVLLAPAGSTATVYALKARYYADDPYEGNLPPDARLKTNVTAGQSPLAVHFDAGESTDPDNSIVRYQWDWEDDGVFDADLPVPEIDHTFTAVGTVNVRLRVTDAAGVWDTATRAISVQPPPPNVAPSAQISPSVLSGPSPLNVDFDASGSSDSDGTITSYSWDWEADGFYDDSGPSAFASHSYAPGLYRPVVRVTDDDGATKTAYTNWLMATPWWQSVASGPVSGAGTYTGAPKVAQIGGLPVLVLGNSSSIRLIRALDPAGTAWDTEQVLDKYAYPGSVALATVNGKPALSFQGNSSLQFSFALDAAGMQWSSTITVNNNIPLRTALVEIPGGLPGIIYTSGNSTNYEVRYVRALDSSCAVWSNAVTLGMATSAGSFSGAQVNGQPAAVWVDSAGQLNYCRALDAGGVAWLSPLVLASGVDSCTELISAAGNPSVAAAGSSGAVYVRAQDADGAAWAPPLELPGGKGAAGSLAIIGGRPALATYSVDLQTRIHYQRAQDSTGTVWDASQLACFGYSPALLDLNGEPALAFSNSGLKFYMVQ